MDDSSTFGSRHLVPGDHTMLAGHCGLCLKFIKRPPVQKTDQRCSVNTSDHPARRRALRCCQQDPWRNSTLYRRTRLSHTLNPDSLRKLCWREESMAWLSTQAGTRQDGPQVDMRQTQPYRSSANIHHASRAATSPCRTAGTKACSRRLCRRVSAHGISSETTRSCSCWHPTSCNTSRPNPSSTPGGSTAASAFRRIS